MSLKRLTTPLALGVGLVLGDALLVPAGIAVGAVRQQGAPRAIVTVDPHCPVLPAGRIPAGEQKPIPVLVRYDPAAPGATLRKPQSLSIELAFNGRNWRDNQRTVQMTRRADGTWEATVPVLYYWHLVVLYVKGDGDGVDNNDGKYWEFLGCGPDGTPTMQAVDNLAATYVGDVLARRRHSKPGGGSNRIRPMCTPRWAATTSGRRRSPTRPLHC